MKILLIDQDTNTLEMLQISLTRAGHTVLIAADGEAGIRLAEKEHPDLIALDILLPGINGFEVCGRLQNNPATRAIPRVVMTALSLPDAAPHWHSHAEHHPFNYQAYFPKPLNMQQFLQYLETHIERTEATRPAGPSVLIISTDPTRDAIVSLLKEKQYNVYGYAQFMKPVEKIRNYPPSVLIIDESLLTPDAWQAFTTLRTQNPIFNLVVIAPPADTPPSYANEVDFVLVPPLSGWQILRLVENLIDYRHAKERAEFLSEQIMALNDELTETRHVYLAQKEELEFVNRRLHELSDLKETLTGMVVHDLKAPLSAMIGALQFLTMDPGNTITEMSQKIIEGGMAAAGQMERLTLTLLDEHKLENNQLVLEPEAVDAAALLSDSLATLQPLFKMHHVGANVNFPADLPPVMADPIMFQRVIENLLDNAVKYSPENENISVFARAVDGMVEFCVADRGEGIPPQHRKIIFERFAQLDTTADLGKIRNGVGLGLTFCKLAVETMGGQIWVDDREGFGAAFYFTLPVDSSESV